MMNFDELLKPAEPANDVAIIEMIKKSNLPVILYGASVDVADQITKKLSDNGIAIQMVVYDEESPVMTGVTRLLKDVETVPVQDIDRKLSAYHVIPGFVKAYSRLASVSAKFKHARSVTYLSEIFDMEMITPVFILENEDYLRSFYNRLMDQSSKEAFVAYLLSKTRQDMQYLPPVFEKNQYFPQGIFTLTDHESYFDCGAYTGDTIADFLKASGGSYKHIWAAEPDRTNYQQLLQFIERQQLPNIETVNKGIYSHTGKLPFQEEGSMLSMISEVSEHYIEVDTIDHITAGRPVTYIKMDVEGAELQALKGAEQTIRTCKPILGISIYHKEHDIINVPAYINKIVPDYTFYFRVHKKLAIDTVLYGIIDR